MNEPSIDQVIAVIQKEADHLMKIAETDDVYRRGSTLLAGLRMYQLGREGALPDEWKQYAEQAKAEADPDYATYQRLKNKFTK